MKNLCAELRPRSNPYEIWRTLDGEWTWRVLKKHQIDDDEPVAQWYCCVSSSRMPNGEEADFYVREIKAVARRCEWCPSCAQALFRMDPNPTVVVRPRSENTSPSSWCQFCGQPIYPHPPPSPELK